MELQIRIPKESAEELKSLLENKKIEIKERDMLFDNPELNTGFEISALITIILGTTTFWTALAEVLKQTISNESIKIEFTDSKTGNIIKMKANNIKEVDGMLKKIQEHNTAKTS